MMKVNKRMKSMKCTGLNTYEHSNSFYESQRFKNYAQHKETHEKFDESFFSKLI